VGSGQDYPFWLFLLDSIAKAVLFAWVYNSTGGSLWAVTLLHASVNTSIVFLPILPRATGDIRLNAISIGLHCLVAVAVVLVTGPALTRWAPSRLEDPPDTGPRIRLSRVGQLRRRSRTRSTSENRRPVRSSAGSAGGTASVVVRRRRWSP
jgi:hypothetical protein